MNRTEYGVQCNQFALHLHFRDWVIEPTLKHSLLLLIVILHLAVIAGVLAWVMAFTLADTGQVWSLTNSSILTITILNTLFVLFGKIKDLGWP